jgi:hypothetical protein
MGMFNSIYADLACPVNGEMSENTEIQIKWQYREDRVLDVYRQGDTLPGLLAEYDNAWVRTDYICNTCSHKTTARDGTKFIRTDDQRWHIVFVHIKDGRIRQILTEHEFESLGINDFIDDVWSPGGTAKQSF